MDESLRELERACEADPRDGAARVRLAGELARAGRSREALDRLELASLSDEHFPAGRKLADEFWRRELSALEPREVFPHRNVLDATLDESTTLAALRSREGELTVVTLRTGEVHHRDPRQDLVPSAPDRIFLASRERLTSVSREAIRIVVTSRDRPPRSSPHDYENVVSVSPGGDMVFVRTDFAARVLAWPSFSTIIERRTTIPQAVRVDWATRSLICPAEESSIPRVWDAVELDSAASYRVEATVVGVLGAGLVWCADRIFDLVSKRRLAVPKDVVWEIGVWSESLSLSSDGRGLRDVMRNKGEGKAFRHEIDRRRGASDDRPVERSAWTINTRQPHEQERIVWHPHANVFARQREGVFYLHALDGEELVRFPDLARPIAWKDGGHALAVMREAGSSNARLEIWRGKGA